jgi:CRP-like cAMP-binding protein
MIERLLLKLNLRDTLPDDEIAALRDALDSPETVAPKMTVVRRGQPLKRSILLLDGLMCRYKDLRNGRRQITALHVPGDFLDLHGFTLKQLDHDVMSLTTSNLCFAPHEKLTRITETFPHLTRMLWFSTNLDAAMHREWELSLGQRSGAARAAHLLCELHTRLKIVELATDEEFTLAMTQTEFGECLGLTVVHTNRVLRELRKDGLATFAKGKVTIHDLERLRAFAEFDPTYLYLGRSPR